MRILTWAKEGISLSLLPELGGKLTTLKRVDSRRNVLAVPTLPLLPANYGDPFEAYASGFDECFPTVSECRARELTGVTWPDHGELWSIPWSFEFRDDALFLEARGRQFPYLFRRMLTIRQNTLRIDYEVLSSEDTPFRGLWSAHPLLAVSPGSRIFLPPEVESLLIQGSEGDRLGCPGDRCSWPLSQGLPLDLLASPQAGWADKLFTDALSQGRCALHDAASDEHVLFRFDPEQTPYLGLWICQGGWPDSERFRHFTVALEPCSSRSDSLEAAVEKGESLLLEKGKPARWWLEIELGRGIPVISDE